MGFLRAVPLCCAAGLASSAANQATAAPTFSVVIDDPGGFLAPYATELEAATLAAADLWGRELESDASIEILIQSSFSVPRATGRSFVSAFRDQINGLFIVDQGMGYEIRTGIDPNGTAPDVELRLNPDYVANEFWFDPDPAARTAPVPSDRLDAVSVMLHELGHALVYNGFINDFDGTYPDAFRSTFDYLTEFSGEHFFHVGTQCQGHYGGPVPLTFGLTDHWGNFGGPGEDLIFELMNGLVFFFGRRYHVSDLDRAVIVDCGLPLRTRCPADFNNDGQADFFDYLDFALAYSNEDPAADFNQDAQVDFFDYLDFVAAFDVGC
ncbi:MAG: hypothetical protein SFZ23_06235 [Planctomycetota bacterium]|nr:hypothetical protein [Planctomycetota bacterium]